MAKLVLVALVAAVVADGVVDAAEVNELRAVFLEDGTIDREEADALFEINDAVSGNDNDASYEPFFVETLASHVLEDEETPGVVDAAEGDWLADAIGADGDIDMAEQALLLNIKANATAIESDKLNSLIAMVEAA